MRFGKVLAALVACCLMVLGGSVATAAAEPPVVDGFLWELDDPPPGLDMLEYETSGGGDYQRLEDCTAIAIFNCDGFTGTLPIIGAGSPGTYPAGSKAEWVYTVPGGPDAYIQEVTATGYNIVENPTEPHAFLGLWNGSSWSAIDENDEGINLELDEVEGEPGDRQVRFGLKADSTVTETSEHWGLLAGLNATLGDDVAPVFDFNTGQVPTGWVDEDPFVIEAPSYDDGLGLAGVVAFGQKRGVPAWAGGGLWSDVWDPDCDGNTADPCPAEAPPDFGLEIRPAEMREGESTVTMAAIDAMNNVSNEGLADNFELKVDTIKPEVELSGSFMTAPGMVLDGPVYVIDSLATDGETGKPNSGVTELEVTIDDEWVESDEAACATENCQLGFDTYIDPDHYGNGPHTLKVKATDGVGHVTTETVEFEVDR